MPQNHEEPDPNPLARAIVLLAVSVVFLGGSIMVGFGAPNVNSNPSNAGVVAFVIGLAVLLYSGIILFHALKAK